MFHKKETFARGRGGGGAKRKYGMVLDERQGRFE